MDPSGADPVPQKPLTAPRRNDGPGRHQHHEHQHRPHHGHPRPRRITQALVVTAVSIGAFINGTTLSLPSAIIPSLVEANLTLAKAGLEANNGSLVASDDNRDEGSLADIPFHVYDTDISFFASVPAFGTLCASLVAGPMANAVGRKWTVVLGANLSLTLGYALIAGARYKWMLFAGRFLHGAATATVSTIVTVYVMEVASADLRGRLAVVPGILGTLGILTVQVLGTLFNWRLLCIICCSFNAVYFLALLCVPETPVHLISKNRIDKAHKVLRMLRGPNWNVTEELTNIKVAADGNKASQRGAAGEGTLQLLRELACEPALRQPFLIGMTLMLFLQMTGINVIISFTQQIFQMAHSSISADQATVYFCLSLLVSNAATLLVADKMPRRLMLLLSSSFVAISLIGLGLFLHFKSVEDPSCQGLNNANSSGPAADEGKPLGAAEESRSVCTSDFGWLPLLILMVYIFFFSLGYGCMIWITVVEIMPQRVRTVATSLTFCFCCVCSFMVALTYLDFIKATSAQTVYWTYGCLSALGFLFILFFVPETKGKTEEEIQGQIRKTHRTADALEIDAAGSTLGPTSPVPSESQPLNRVHSH